VSDKRKRIIRLLLALAVLLAVVATALFFWFRSNVLSIYEKASRKALVEAGLERVEMPTPAGSLVYWQGGQGPPLMLIHGAGHQAGVWAATAEGLIDRYTVLVPDLPGHGESDPIEGPLTMAVLYGDLEALVDATDESAPIVLVGNSLGAWLAMIQAHRHPESVARVIAVNGGALFNDPGELTLLPADREQARRLVEALRDPSSQRIPDFVLDDLVERSATGPVARMMQDWEGLEAHLLDGRLGEITTPIDLLWGESDYLMPLSYARRLDTALPHSRLTTIPSCGHMPHTECPEKFSAALSIILASDPPGDPTDDSR